MAEGEGGMSTLDIHSIPHEVLWQDIVQFEKLDERVARANDICLNIIGINEGYVEWCPNNDPPNYLLEFLTCRI